MTPSQETRNDSFRTHRDSGHLGDQQRRVMLLFHAVGAQADYSSKEVAQALHIERSAAVARLNELEKLGYLEWGNKRPCRHTGKTITPLKLPMRQGSLFQ